MNRIRVTDLIERLQQCPPDNYATCFDGDNKFEICGVSCHQFPLVTGIEIDSKSATIADLEDENAAMHKDLNRLEDDKYDLEKNVEKLEEELETAKERINELEAELKQAQEVKPEHVTLSKTL